MRADEARNWLRRLQEQYPTAGVTDVRASGRGFKVTYCRGELSLQLFQQQFAGAKQPPAK